MPVDAVSRFLAVLAVVAGPGGLLLLALRHRAVVAPLREHALPAAAAIAATATAGSLWYSQVVGFVPCELCWWQRLAMYPLALLLTVAAVRRDDAVRPYARVLAAGGLLVSLWHVGVQRLPAMAGTTSCAADNPCSLVWVDVAGVFTIPTMAACGFVGVLVLLSLRRAPAPTSGADWSAIATGDADPGAAGVDEARAATPDTERTIPTSTGSRS